MTPSRFGVDGIAGDHVVDAGHHVLVVRSAPAAPRAPQVLLAVFGRPARVGIEDRIALRRPQLELDGEVVAVGAVRAAVDGQDQRHAIGRVGRLGQDHPTLDRRAVLAREPHRLGRPRPDRRQQRVVERRQPPLAAAIERRDEHFGGMGRVAGDVGDALRVPGNRCSGEAPGAARHLLHGAAGERHAKEVRRAGDSGRELQHTPFRRDTRRARDVVPRRGEVHRRAAHRPESGTDPPASRRPASPSGSGSGSARAARRSSRRQTRSAPSDRSRRR